LEMEKEMHKAVIAGLKMRLWYSSSFFSFPLIEMYSNTYNYVHPLIH
jgi:hypothetical protein